MTKMKIALAAAVLTLPLVSFGGSAGAATAHNSQSGANTSNPTDTAATAYMKQVRVYNAPQVQYRHFYGAVGQ